MKHTVPCYNYSTKVMRQQQERSVPGSWISTGSSSKQASGFTGVETFTHLPSPICWGFVPTSGAGAEPLPDTR